MNVIKNILWPTDASNSALNALDAAILLASKFAAKIHALQVVEQVPRLTSTGFAGDPVTAFDFPFYEEKLMQAARDNLSRTLGTKVPGSIDTEINVELGLPKDTILEFCRDHEIDMIVMATHGRTGLSQFWLGSVAESTVRQAPVPVLVVPIEGQDE